MARIFLTVNPVNAQTFDATIIAVREGQIWLSSGDDPEAMFRGWLAPGLEKTLQHDQEAIVYLDAERGVNGWWASEAQVGVNQRLCEAGKDQKPATLTCQGECGRPWVCPAPEELLGNSESCLNCAGPLAA